MFTHHRTQGFILKKNDSGEADRLFTVYTKNFGKLELLAKAVRKIKSKLRAGLEIFYLSEIEFIQAKTHKTLTDAILINSFKNLKKDLARLTIAYRISETFDKLVRGQESDEKIWKLLSEVFEKLNSLKIRNLKLEILYYYFLWNFLSLLGYQPELYRCVFCQKRLVPEKLYFNAKEGGIICHNCFKKVKLVEEDKSSSSPFAAARVGKEVSIGTIKILRIILAKNWATLSKLKIEKSYLKSLNIISKGR